MQKLETIVQEVRDFLTKNEGPIFQEEDRLAKVELEDCN